MSSYSSTLEIYRAAVEKDQIQQDDPVLGGLIWWSNGEHNCIWVHISIAKEATNLPIDENLKVTAETARRKGFLNLHPKASLREELERRGNEVPIGPPPGVSM